MSMNPFRRQPPPPCAACEAYKSEIAFLRELVAEERKRTERLADRALQRSGLPAVFEPEQPAPPPEPGGARSFLSRREEFLAGKQRADDQMFEQVKEAVRKQRETEAEPKPN